MLGAAGWQPFCFLVRESLELKATRHSAAEQEEPASDVRAGRKPCTAAVASDTLYPFRDGQTQILVSPNRLTESKEERTCQKPRV